MNKSAGLTEAEIARLLADYIVAEIAPTPPATPPGPDVPIIEQGLVDSLGLFKLIAFVEERLGVKIAPEEIVLEHFATIRAIVALIQGKR
jgi:acyl carrier protein